MSTLIQIRKKAQAWGFDLMGAAIIFLVGITLLYVYALNISSEPEEVIDDLIYDGNLVSDLILSEGVPENWNQESVEVPGLLTNGKINQSKLNMFYDLYLNNYGRLKKLLNTRYDFYFYIDCSEEQEIIYDSGDLCLDTGVASCPVGHCYGVLSDYVIELDGSWTAWYHYSSADAGESYCGDPALPGVYYTHGRTTGGLEPGNITVNITDYLPFTGKYVLKFNYRIGSLNQNDENFSIKCGDANFWIHRILND